MRNPRKKKAVNAHAALIAASLPHGLARPALRALAAAGMTCLSDLQAASAKEIAELHGMGPKAMTTLQSALAQEGMSFRGRGDGLSPPLRRRTTLRSE